MPSAVLGKGMLYWSIMVSFGKVLYCHNVLIISQGPLKFSCAPMVMCCYPLADGKKVDNEIFFSFQGDFPDIVPSKFTDAELGIPPDDEN